MRPIFFTLPFLLAASSVRADRPLLVAGVGAGVDIEPERSGAREGLGAFAFEGAIVGRQWGLVLRGVGTDGSIDYVRTGFDRLGFTAAATWHPGWRRANTSYAGLVIRRFAFELGLTYQRLLTGFSGGNSLGFHVGAHVDLPFVRRDDGTGPFLRLCAQHPLVFADETISPNAGSQASSIEAGAPIVQILAFIAVAF